MHNGCLSYSKRPLFYTVHLFIYLFVPWCLISPILAWNLLLHTGHVWSDGVPEATAWGLAPSALLQRSLSNCCHTLVYCSTPLFPVLCCSFPVFHCNVAAFWVLFESIFVVERFPFFELTVEQLLREAIRVARPDHLSWDFATSAC